MRLDTQVLHPTDTLASAAGQRHRIASAAPSAIMAGKASGSVHIAGRPSCEAQRPTATMASR